jgi:hypothetical protein
VSLSTIRVALEAIAHVVDEGPVHRWATMALAELEDEESRRAQERDRGRRRRMDASGGRAQLSLSSSTNLDHERSREGEREREPAPDPPESSTRLVAAKAAPAHAAAVAEVYDWRAVVAPIALERPRVNWDFARAKYDAWRAEKRKPDTLSSWLRFAGNERAPPEQLSLAATTSPQSSHWTQDYAAYRETLRHAVPMPSELRAMLEARPLARTEPTVQRKAQGDRS